MSNNKHSIDPFLLKAFHDSLKKEPDSRLSCCPVHPKSNEIEQIRKSATYELRYERGD